MKQKIHLNETDFQRLLDRYLAGTATAGEVQQAEAFFESYQLEAKQEEYSIMGAGKTREDQLLESIYERYDRKHRSARALWLHRAWRVAASVLLVLLVGYGTYFWQSYKTNSVALEDISPGTNKALLTFSDGSTLNLSSEKEGIVVQSGEIAYNDGTTIFGMSHSDTETQGSSPHEIGKSEEILLTTPRGGQYQLTLVDGTKVWLNADASLRYPVAFLGTTREVELTGEAFFEVAQNPTQPFIINSGGLSTTVLGTSFNVKAYENEPIAITVATGKVKVEQSDSSTLHRGRTRVIQSQHLTANQQIIYNTTTGQLEKYKADLTLVLAWRNDLFRFEDTPLLNIMQQVARWYDVDVKYEGSIPDQRFVGIISRQKSIAAVLDMLASTGEVAFDIEGSTVIVKNMK